MEEIKIILCLLYEYINPTLIILTHNQTKLPPTAAGKKSPTLHTADFSPDCSVKPPPPTPQHWAGLVA